MTVIPSIDTTVSAIPQPGHRSIDIRDTFVSKQEAYQDHQVNILEPQLNAIIVEQNEAIAGFNTLALEVSDEVTALASTLLASSTFRGDWIAGYNTTGYMLGDTITYSDGKYYISKVDDNLTEPSAGVSTASWNYFNTFVGANNPTFTGAVTEEVFIGTVGGTVSLNANNGTLQKLSVSGIVVIQDNLLDGQHILVVLVNGSASIVHYPAGAKFTSTVTPTLGSEDILVFIKLDGTLYVNHLGTV